MTSDGTRRHCRVAVSGHRSLVCTDSLSKTAAARGDKPHQTKLTTLPRLETMTGLNRTVTTRLDSALTDFLQSPHCAADCLQHVRDRLVGLVVKASASRAEGPGFESRLRRDFFGVESYQWLKNWHSSGYPARRLALQGQRWDWSARCQYTVTG